MKKKISLYRDLEKQYNKIDNLHADYVQCNSDAKTFIQDAIKFALGKYLKLPKNLVIDIDFADDEGNIVDSIFHIATAYEYIYFCCYVKNKGIYLPDLFYKLNYKNNFQDGCINLVNKFPAKLLLSDDFEKDLDEGINLAKEIKSLKKRPITEPEAIKAAIKIEALKKLTKKEKEVLGL